MSRNRATKELAGVIAEILSADDPERRPDFAKKARVGAGPPPLEAEPLFYGIAGFCEAHGISRSGLYALWRQGIGPKVIKLGKAVKISREAAAQWRVERQAATDQAA